MFEPTTRHLFVASLRHGTGHAALGAEGDLKAIVNALRAARPGVAVHVRGDAGAGGRRRTTRARAAG